MWAHCVNLNSYVIMKGAYVCRMSIVPESIGDKLTALVWLVFEEY